MVKALTEPGCSICIPRRIRLRHAPVHCHGRVGLYRDRKRQALDYIEADYPRFAILGLKRFIYFWAGPPRLAKIWWLAEVKNSLFLASSVLMFWGLARALRQRKPGAWLLFWLILLYPAIYYVVYPGQRYRHPIEPEMTILGIYLLTEAGKKEIGAQ
jgi:hypothetical protein